MRTHNDATRHSRVADDAYTKMVTKTWVKGKPITNDEWSWLTVADCLSAGHAPPENIIPMPLELRRPDIVITGIGDSGTRGVHDLLQNLGVAMSSATNPAHDDIMTRPALSSLPSLLNASGGAATRPSPP